MPGWSEFEVVQRVLERRRAPDPRWTSGPFTRIDDARAPLEGEPSTLTRAARRNWVERLAGGSEALRSRLEWGVVGPDDAFTAGAALNAALLHAAGRRVVLVDEDVHPELVEPPAGERGPRGDPTALEVRLGDDDADGAGRASPLADVLSTLPETLAAPVASFGLWGDGGMRSSSVYLMRAGGWLAARAEAWPRIAASRVVRRAAPTPTRGAHLMSAALLLDLRGFMPPPLLPVLRNTDGLWGRHLAARDEAALHLPWAMRHAHKPHGTSRTEALRDLVRPRATDLLSLLPPSAWAEVRGPAGWRSALLGPWRAHLERVAERLDDARRLAPRSATALHEDLGAALRSLAEACRQVPPPVDLAVPEPWTELAALAVRYLELDEVWPEAWGRARAVLRD